MRLARGSFVVLGLAVLWTGVDVSELHAEAAAGKPNIVVIYMDDFSPLTPWLWCKESRTPALAKFCKEGVWFQNAVVADPLCCPARANTFTGKWGHNNGVTRNDIRRFDPRFTIPVKLKKSGYVTGFVGKYLNGLAREAPTRASVARYAQGWDDFDVIWENQGEFYDYRLWTKSRTRHYGSRPKDHSSHVAGVRAARHIRQAPRDKPIFEFISLFDGHKPHDPMRRFKDHPKCRNVKSWKSPAFNESGVADKPGYIQKTRRLSRDHKDLRGRCAEVMTVDWVARKVRLALRKTGRLDDTLLIFTADNGIVMGEHRLTSKTYPYTTPVPLYMLWPRELGNVARVVDEPVSNVDYGETFCELAGCRMPNSDGDSIVSLITGSSDRLERTFVYEEILHPGPNVGGRPAWYGIRTTKAYSETLWVYTEYASGERELYDLTADPHQLDNLAGLRPEIQADLRRLLHDEVIRPNKVRFRSTRLR